MVKANVVYQGQKHCELTHGPSGSKIETDAPKDNFGKGERFSPTDLLGAALASCVLTTMAIVAERDGVEFENAKAEVVKEMADQPRRVARLSLSITLSAKLPLDYRQKLEMIAKTCPVARSLSSDVQIPVGFTYV